VLKQALTLDGKTATVTGDSKWISSHLSREYVHKLRARSQSIMVGIGTIIKDNPYLTTHGKGKNTIRIVIDKGLDMPLNARFMKNDSRRIIITASENSKKSLKLEKIGCEVYRYQLKNGFFELKKVFSDLYNKGITNVLLESGSRLAGSFFDEKLIDEVVYFIAPKLVGGITAPGAIAGKGIVKISQAAELENIQVDVIDTDFLIRGNVKYKR
jgi:diaminohydroxyphosphoribosylaminopyrimidine deaminase/5-amino-6-(5-phosphoribosylamino)uracil reductase